MCRCCCFILTANAAAPQTPSLQAMAQLCMLHQQLCHLQALQQPMPQQQLHRRHLEVSMAQVAVQQQVQVVQQRMGMGALAVQQEVQLRAQQAPWLSNTPRHCLQQQLCS